jgi:hypothetical protein
MMILLSKCYLGEFQRLHQGQEVTVMQFKNHFAGMALAAALLVMLGSGCASSPSQIQQPPPTSYTRSTVGTPDELSPQAPGEAQNVRKVGDHWQCEVNGKIMIYNNATACWEPRQK